MAVGCVILTWLDHAVSHFQAAFQHSWPTVSFLFAPLQHRLELVSTCGLATYLSIQLFFFFWDSHLSILDIYLYKLASVKHLIMIL